MCDVCDACMKAIPWRIFYISSWCQKPGCISLSCHNQDVQMKVAVSVVVAVIAGQGLVGSSRTTNRQLQLGSQPANWRQVVSGDATGSCLTAHMSLSLSLSLSLYLFFSLLSFCPSLSLFSLSLFNHLCSYSCYFYIWSCCCCRCPCSSLHTRLLQLPLSTVFPSLPHPLVLI